MRTPLHHIMRAANYAAARRVPANFLAVILSNILAVPLIREYALFRVSDQLVIVHSAIVGLLLILFFHLLLGRREGRRTIRTCSAIGIVGGFVAGMLAYWPTGLLISDIEITLNTVRLSFRLDRPGLLFLVMPLNSIAMHSWIVGGVAGFLFALLETIGRARRGAPDLSGERE